MLYLYTKGPQKKKLKNVSVETGMGGNGSLMVKKLF